jgi:hypothetical protein
MEQAASRVGEPAATVPGPPHGRTSGRGCRALPWSRGQGHRAAMAGGGSAPPWPGQVPALLAQYEVAGATVPPTPAPGSTCPHQGPRRSHRGPLPCREGLAAAMRERETERARQSWRRRDLSVPTRMNGSKRRSRQASNVATWMSSYIEQASPGKRLLRARDSSFVQTSGGFA